MFIRETKRGSQDRFSIISLKKENDVKTVFLPQGLRTGTLETLSSTRRIFVNNYPREINAMHWDFELLQDAIDTIEEFVKALSPRFGEYVVYYDESKLIAGSVKTKDSPKTSTDAAGSW